MKKLLIPVLSLLLVGITTQAQQFDYSKSTIINCEGVGIIRMKDDAITIQNKVGKKQYKWDKVVTTSDQTVQYLTVYPNSSKELRIFFREEESPYKTIDKIEITHPQTVWQTSQGITIGSTLEQLVQYNGNPIDLYGFGWQFGGAIISFKGGRLEKELPCLTGAFELGGQMSSEDADFIEGAATIHSNFPQLKKYKPTLNRIWILNTNKR